MYIAGVFYCFCSAALLQHVFARSVTSSVLVRGLMEADDVHVSPNADQHEPVVVKVGLTVTGIQHENPESDVIKVHGYLTLQWKNDRLSWDPMDYNNITVARVPSDQVWLPDITLFNSFDAQSGILAEAKKLSVTSDGSVLWMPPVTFPLSCNTTEKGSGGNAEGSKNGEISCSIILGSWAYDESLIDVQPESDKIDDTAQSSRYRLTESHITRVSGYYPCCKEAYASIQITFKAQRIY